MHWGIYFVFYLFCFSILIPAHEGVWSLLRGILGAGRCVCGSAQIRSVRISEPGELHKFMWETNEPLSSLGVHYYV